MKNMQQKACLTKKKKKGEYAQNVLIYMRGTTHLKIVHKTLNKLSEADIKHL